jgi:toxin FitB
MILLDTNVISELWKPLPAASVQEWMDAQIIETLYLPTIVVAEIRFGIAAMAAGKRRDVFYQRFEQEVLPLFEGRVLSFDLPASQAFADLMTKTKIFGQPVGTADGYIAAIAAANGLIVATRDTTPFEVAGLKTINPWKGGV